MLGHGSILPSCNIARRLSTASRRLALTIGFLSSQPPTAQYGSVRCYESGGIYMYNQPTPSDPYPVITRAPFQQPPPGYPQFDHQIPAKFDGGARHVCVCASSNHTDAAYIGTGAWDTRTSFGADCAVYGDSCNSNPCQNGGQCTDANAQYVGAAGFTCACAAGWSGPTCDFAEHAPPTQPLGGTVQAVATFNQDGVVGSITMTQSATDPTAPTAVVVHLTGLEDGPNPWHVHARAVTIDHNCGAASTGGHFLESDKRHGDIWDLGAAMSLLGAEAAVDAIPGVVDMSATDASLPLSGDQSVIGRSIVIHKKTNNEPWVCATINRISASKSCGIRRPSVSRAIVSWMTQS